MREIKKIHIFAIKIVDTIPLNTKTMELAIKIFNKEIDPNDLPPIKVFCDSNGVHRIKDGRTRYTALRLCGHDYINCIISKPKHIKN